MESLRTVRKVNRGDNVKRKTINSKNNHCLTTKLIMMLGPPDLETRSFFPYSFLFFPFRSHRLFFSKSEDFSLVTRSPGFERVNNWTPPVNRFFQNDTKHWNQSVVSETGTRLYLSNLSNTVLLWSHFTPVRRLKVPWNPGSTRSREGLESVENPKVDFLTGPVDLLDRLKIIQNLGLKGKIISS